MNVAQVTEIRRRFYDKRIALTREYSVAIAARPREADALNRELARALAMLALDEQIATVADQPSAAAALLKKRAALASAIDRARLNDADPAAYTRLILGEWAAWYAEWAIGKTGSADWLARKNLRANFAALVDAIAGNEARGGTLASLRVSPATDDESYGFWALLWQCAMPAEQWRAYVYYATVCGADTGFITGVLVTNIRKFLRDVRKEIKPGTPIEQLSAVDLLAIYNFTADGFDVRSVLTIPPGETRAAPITREWLLGELLASRYSDAIMIPEPPEYDPTRGDNFNRNVYNRGLYYSTVIDAAEEIIAGAESVVKMPPYSEGYKADKTFSRFVWIASALVGVFAGVTAAGGMRAALGHVVEQALKPLVDPIRFAGHFLGTADAGTFALEVGTEAAKDVAIKEVSESVGALAAPIVGTAAGIVTGDWTPGASEWIGATNAEARGALTTELVQAGVASPIAGAVAGQFSVTQLPNLANVPGDVTEAIKNLDLTVTLPDLEALQSIDLNAPDLPDLAVKLPDLDAGNLAVSMPDIHLPDLPATAPAGAPLTRAPADTSGATVVLSDKPAPWGLLLLAALAALSA